MRFNEPRCDIIPCVNNRREEFFRFRWHLDTNSIVRGQVGGAVAVEAERDGFVVFLVVIGFVLGGADGVQVRAAGARVVGHVDAHHVVGHGRHGRRVRRRARGRVRRRRSPLYTQPANARTSGIVADVGVRVQRVVHSVGAAAREHAQVGRARHARVGERAPRPER